MRKTAIKFMILSITLLLSISSIALGESDSVTAIGDIGGTNTANTTSTNTNNVAINETQIGETPVSTSEDLTVAEDTYPPSETGDNEKPVETPKSPGFESVALIMVLLSAIYIIRRR